MMVKVKKAFTLIELLIVVAIIAILAAIAVPNFLEAQTRSKVSRVKADQRSLTTAIETYKIDWNYYPFDNSWWVMYPGWPADMMRDKLGILTSPQAYITTVPIDPFGGCYNHMYPDYDTNEPWAKWYFYENIWYGHEYWAQGQTLAEKVLAGPQKQAYYTAQWQMNSDGPFQTWYYPKGSGSFPAPGGGTTTDVRAVPYDPTNGTKSLGVISRFGP